MVGSRLDDHRRDDLYRYFALHTYIIGAINTSYYGLSPHRRTARQDSQLMICNKYKYGWSTPYWSHLGNYLLKESCLYV